MEIEYIDINQLQISDYNPRSLSDEQFNQIKDSLERFGFVDPVIRNIHPDRHNVVVGGAQRTKVAKAIGYTQVPCYSVNLDYESERELNVRLNKNTGDWDFNLLQEFFDSDELLDWGFYEGELPFLDNHEEDHWDDNMPDFNPDDSKDIKVMIHFQTERDREEFVKNHNLSVDSNKTGVWVVKM